jgi:hypothetical protein
MAIFCNQQPERGDKSEEKNYDFHSLEVEFILLFLNFNNFNKGKSSSRQRP